MRFQKGNTIGHRFQKGNPSRPEPIELRLEKHSMPEPNSGCHLWFGALNRDGYAEVWADGRTRKAATVAYELENGPVPEGLVLDHLCRTRCCVNPAHLEPVTSKENTARGMVAAVVRARIDFSAPCPHGDDHRVIWYTRGDGRRQKTCLTCKSIRKREKRNAKSPAQLAV